MLLCTETPRKVKNKFQIAKKITIVTIKITKKLTLKISRKIIRGIFVLYYKNIMLTKSCELNKRKIG